MTTLDFTSVLYLGFRHGSKSVHPWSQLTMGVPAALVESPIAQVVAGRLALLQGCQQATVGSSTLHLFWDLFGQLAGHPIAIFLDNGAYPIATWGIERAAARGARVYRFPHRDVNMLGHILRQNVSSGRRPVVVSDGLCAACGCALPLADYLDQVRQVNGLLVIDDTQALGLLGFSPDSDAPYGHLGGGSLPHQAISGPELVVVSSLAKSFGVPMAVLSGEQEVVRVFQAHSETRVHCSPPSLATVHAAQQAIALNEKQGDRRRRQLARNVACFRRLLKEAGLFTVGGFFPVQTLRLPPGIRVARLYESLCANGVSAILRRGCDGEVGLSFVITARHRLDEIIRLVEKLDSMINTKGLHRSKRRSLYLAQEGDKL